MLISEDNSDCGEITETLDTLTSVAQAAKDIITDLGIQVFGVENI